jgi:hypothetical protein
LALIGGRALVSLALFIELLGITQCAYVVRGGIEMLCPCTPMVYAVVGGSSAGGSSSANGDIHSSAGEKVPLSRAEAIEDPEAVTAEPPFSPKIFVVTKSKDSSGSRPSSIRHLPLASGGSERALPKEPDSPLICGSAAGVVIASRAYTDDD